MKAFFRSLLLSLVLLVVALVSALTAMRFAIHGREVAVPNLTSMSPNEARKILRTTDYVWKSNGSITVQTCQRERSCRKCRLRERGSGVDGLSMWHRALDRNE